MKNPDEQSGIVPDDAIEVEDLDGIAGGVAPHSEA
jgi:hypothetical protein